MSIFSDSKDAILSLIEDRDSGFLKFPLQKLGKLLNGYMFGDFIVVGGRKTGGRGSFILNNYVISPLIQKMNSKDKTLKVIYFNSRGTPKNIMEKMAVNYISNKAGGNKISIPAIYGLEGANAKMSIDNSKKMISQVFNIFHKLTENGDLNLITGKRSFNEIEMYIENVMEEYGEFDDDNDFIFNEAGEHSRIILAIDDVTGIVSEGSKNSLRGDSAHVIGNSLRALAKKFGILIVLSMPANPLYRPSQYRSSTEEVSPFHIYSDRAIVMHSPLETDSVKFIGYDTEDWINAKTGICYLRTMFVASNNMGASGLYVAAFMYPENGYFKELPKADDEDSLFKYLDLVTK